MHWSELKSRVGFNSFAEENDSLVISLPGCCFMSEGMQSCPSVGDTHINSWIKVMFMGEPSA